MKILITGGAGFIGSNFICTALKKGHTIINIDKLTYAGNLGNLENYIDHPNYFFYKTDICNEKEVKNIILKHEPDIILNMAAESHVDRSIDSPKEFIITNVCGTQNLLEASYSYFKSIEKKEDFRFIHLSTDEVFGALGPSGEFNEESAYKPNSPYAASKASSDLLVRSYYKTYNFPAIIVNSSNNYGPKQYPEKLIPLTILNALEFKELPVYGKGEQIRDWLFVEDHVEALLSVISYGKIGESYCIGANNEVSNLNLVKLICRALDQIKPWHQPYETLITFTTDRPGHDFRYAINAAKLKEHTKWEPQTNFQSGIFKTVEWYLNNFENFKRNNEARSRIGVIS